MSDEDQDKPANRLSKLTSRQLAVIKRIDRRVPIKVIAMELGVSETRINQHIRALKDIFNVESLNQLVEAYRIVAPSDHKKDGGLPGGEPLIKSSFRKKQVQNLPDSTESVGRDFADASPSDRVDADDGSAIDGEMAEPRIVPGVLDGDHAVLLRLMSIVGIAFGVLAAVILTVVAGIILSEVLDGRVSVPVDHQQPAG